MTFRLTSIIALLLTTGTLLAADPAPAAESPVAQPASAPSDGHEAKDLIAPKSITPITHIEKRGTGPIPMVLVPGVGCDWRVFDSFMTRNADRYTMYAITLPGFGGTTPPPAATIDSVGEGPWLENSVDAILKVINDLKLEKPVVVGHSLGSHLALRLAERTNDRLRAVVSLDGAPAFPLTDMKAKVTREEREKYIAEQVSPFFARMSEEMWKGQQASMGSTMARDPESAKQVSAYLAESPKATTQRYLLELMAADITDQLADIKIPVLHISCITDEDAGADKNDIKEWVINSFKTSTMTDVVFFEDTRHFVMFDAPKELDTAIDDFLSGRQVKGIPAKPKAPTAPKPAMTPSATAPKRTPAPASKPAPNQH